MSNFVVQVHKHAKSNKAPAINLPANLPPQELLAPDLVKVGQELFAANGVLVVNNLFSQASISILYRSFIERYQFYFEDKEYADALKVGNKRRMLTLDFRSPFNDPNIYGNPFLLYLMRSLLGSGFVLGSFGAVIALPGAKHQHVHRDHPPLFDDEALDLKIPSFAITLVVPLIDLTPETGSTRVWKGSHRISPEQDLDMEDSFVPFVPTGSCYLMDYQLLHGGTPNISTRVRPILYITYYRSWFQETVNYEQQARLSVTKREYEKIPEKYKFLFERVRDSLEFLRTSALQEEKQTNGDFEQLTATEQARKLAEIAKQALTNYALKPTQIKLIAHGENTVFSVSAPGSPSDGQDNSPYLPNRFILRIHRANYLSVQAIESELRWLRSLHHEAELPVPDPISTLEGKLYTLACSPDIPEPRVCSLTRWVNGRSLYGEDESGQLKSLEIESVGRLLGQLHHYAAQWLQPESFIRPAWNWNGLFGERAGYSNNGTLVWELTPQPYRNLFEDVSTHVKAVMALLGEGSEQFGMIHGDFWLGNLLVCDRKICPIDFADCGFGYWGYDIARFLNDFSHSKNFALCLDKLLAGYTQIRAFPHAQLSHINTFIAAQQVALALWQINRAQEHPSFRSTLEEDLQETAEEIETFLS